MLALYRSGRQAEALEAYRDARAALDELGIEPGAALRRLEKQILTQDAALEPRRERLLAAEPCPASGSARADAAVSVRRPLARAGGAAHAARAGRGRRGRAGAARRRGGRREDAARPRAGARGGGPRRARAATAPPTLRSGRRTSRCGNGSSSCSASAIADALAECLGDDGETLARLVPELERLTGPPAPPTGDLESDRYLLQSAAVELLRRLSRLQPLLLVADDVHWSDGETLQLLRRLARVGSGGAACSSSPPIRDRGEEIGARALGARSPICHASMG